MRFLLIAAAVVALDQSSKVLISRAIPAGAARAVIPGLVHLRPVRNFGAAFGVLPHWTFLFVAIAVVAVALMAYYYRRLTWRSPAAKVGLALAAAGALGNLLDRLRFGYVRDFVAVRWYPAVFNVADMAIVVGLGLLLLALWREEAR